MEAERIRQDNEENEVKTDETSLMPGVHTDTGLPM